MDRMPANRKDCQPTRRRNHIGALASFTLTAILAMFPQSVFASFHFMQIELVVGGVNGNITAQAIQLRTRAAAQEQVNRGKLIAWDAEGQNPVLLVDFDDPVSNNAGGARILAATGIMASYTDPPVDPDFILVNPIPASYLAAGSLTFENDEETLIVWRLSWGGANYTGDTTGALTNDDDREFGPPVNDPLPTGELLALTFAGTFDAKSTSNESDYVLSDGHGVLTNNAGDEFILVPADCSDADGAGPDSDGDGVRDVCDDCPADALKTEPGICGCGVSDVDSDGDGIPNCNDQGGSDNGNSNTNGNTNDNTDDDNENDNDDPGNANDNTDDNDNQNTNDNTPGDNDDDDSANDNTGGGSGAPRGCTGGIGLVFISAWGLLSWSVIRSRSSRSPRRSPRH